jgi:mannose-1-phosphate guanylyltransferase
MSPNHYAVIMAGGIGSRFWPMSRTQFPKQFHDIMGTGRSLLQATYDRFCEIVPAENIQVVTNAGYVEMVHQQLPALAPQQVLAEPIGRNTAPCIAYATFKLLGQNPQAQVVVSPADHLIRDTGRFRHDILAGLENCATHQQIVTLGIQPTRPDTGYGYIQYLEEGEGPCHRVKTFTEKPELEMAKTFLRSGDFLWNSGIFIFSAQTMAEAIQRYLPEMFELFEAERPALNSAAEAEAIQRVYAEVRPISIDYGVMEKAENVFVIPSNFDWSDLGTWNSLFENMEKDFHGNAVTGNVMVFGANNNVVKGLSDKLIVLKGVEELIVVDTDDVLLICPKAMEQSVKEIVSEIKQTKGEKYL